MEKLMLTIFTPTYNRAFILPRLYMSLCEQRQDGYGFEWLIIDDESSDGTNELVENWKKESSFEIRYFKQKHGGKHRALNKAFELAKGEFIFIVDSDDKLTDNAIPLINSWLKNIRDKHGFAGVAGLKVSNEGKIWGGDVGFLDSYVDATDFERRKYNLLGDKAEVYRVSLLKKFKFPEIQDEYFITEDYCWMQIAAEGYKLRWYNQPIYICEYLEDGLTNTGANSIIGHANNYKGYCLYIKKCIELKPFSEKMVHLKEYNRTAKTLKKTYKARVQDIQKSLVWYFAMCVFGIPIAYLIRKVRLRK